MKKEKGKRFDGKSRVSNEAYKNGWNESLLKSNLKKRSRNWP